MLGTVGWRKFGVKGRDGDKLVLLCRTVLWTVHVTTLRCDKKPKCLSLGKVKIALTLGTQSL